MRLSPAAWRNAQTQNDIPQSAVNMGTGAWGVCLHTVVSVWRRGGGDPSQLVVFRAPAALCEGVGLERRAQN